MARVALILALATLAGACSGDAASTPRMSMEEMRARAATNHQKVLLLCLDGISFRVLDPLLEGGRLPHLERLVREGVRADLDSIAPLVSPAVWTTVATGRPREDHGITGHTVKLVGKPGMTPVVSTLRRTKALWNILADWGRRIGVTGYMVTYPAENFPGWMITYSPRPKDADCFEPDSIRRLLNESAVSAAADAGPRMEALTDWPDTSDFAQYPRETTDFRVGRALHRIRSDMSTGLWLLRSSERLSREMNPDLTVYYTHVTDEAGHLFWRYFEPGAYPDATDAEELASLKNVLPGTYEFADYALGRLRAALGPRLNVIVVSDHGMHADPEGIRAYGTNPLLEALGWLTYRERATGEKRVDYGRTRVFDETEFFAAKRGLFLNLEDREAQGTVAADDFEALKAEVIATLSALRTASGEALYTSVKDTTSVSASGVQDFDVTLEANTALQDDDVIVLPAGGTMPLARLFWSTGASGNHEPNGVLLASGPAFKAGAVVESPSVIDVAPTILAILGIPASDEMPGRVWTEVLDEGLLAEFPPVRIPTFEDGSSGEQRAVGLTGEAEAEAMERLRELGYVQDE